MSLLHIGVSGLKAYQTSLSTTGHNIANANTAGYSRQEVMLESALPQFHGYGYVGAGVNIQDIRRISDQFLTEQLRDETQTFQGFQTWQNNIEQVNRLLADEKTGIAPVVNRFFAALQSAADSPSSIPAREVLLGEANAMTERFDAIGSNFLAHNEVLNGQLQAMTSELNALSQGVANLNERIIFYRGNPEREQPNDLLDQRDEMIRRMAELTAVSVSEDDGVVSVFIGSGQALVQGLEASKLAVVEGVADPSQKDIRFSNQTENVILTDKLKTGGQIAGTLNFRDDTLNPAIASLGRVAMGISTAMNEQHHLGIDLKGNFGKDFFNELNEPQLQRERVQSFNTNKEPNDRILSLRIDDATQVLADDYIVEFTGPNNFTYQITQVSNGEQVARDSLSGDYPHEISFDGVTLVFEQGSFARGDQFLVQPTRGVATNFEVNVKLPSEIALASPVKATTGLGNLGTGKIDQGLMQSLAGKLFADPGALLPPLVIQFDSADRYSVLDNTNPLRPVPLNPPMNNLPFEPGGNLFPWAQGETQVSSFAPVLPSAPFFQRANAALVDVGNGFNPEVMTFKTTDPETGKVVDSQILKTPANATAAEIAATMNSLQGVEARASTTVELSNFTSTSATPYNPDVAMHVWVNGYKITESDLLSGQTIFSAGFDADYPVAMNSDFLADRINHHFDLQKAGVTAKSDGETLTIFDRNGHDITVEMIGDAAITPAGPLTGSVMPGGAPIIIQPGDSFEVSNGESYALSVASGNTRGFLTQNAGFDFSQGGPYQYEFNIPGGPSGLVELDQAYATGEEVLKGIEAAVDRLLTAPGHSKASIDEKGNISFKIYTPMRGHSNNDSDIMVIGGKVDAVLPENMTLSTTPPYGKVFSGEPDALPMFLGFDFKIDGSPETGDTFTIEFNSDGSGDNRNALEMAALAYKDTLNAREGGMTFTESYAQLVEQIGTKTRELQVRSEASQGSLDQVTAQRDSIAGVNLDEEAARLIQFENAYNATAQIIRIAQETFDALLAAF